MLDFFHTAAQDAADNLDLALPDLANGTLTEAALLDLLAARVTYLLDGHLEQLLNVFYRLDITEQRVDAAVADDALAASGLDPAQALARLILARHYEKLRTRIAYPQPPIEGLDEALKY